MSRVKKFFGDILSEEVIDKPRPKKVDAVDYSLLEVVWDAFNGRGKRASKPVEEYHTADEYAEYPEEVYLMLEEIGAFEETGDCQWL